MSITKIIENRHEESFLNEEATPGVQWARGGGLIYSNQARFTAYQTSYIFPFPITLYSMWGTNDNSA